MTSESQAIGNWCALVASRANEIGRSDLAATGEEFTTSGDLKLDNRVARILLDTRQNYLPSYGWVNEDESVTMGRYPTKITGRKVQLLPVLLFEIDWAATAPGVGWPEAYYVTYVPEINVRIVTASRDDSDIWGYADLAIGMCRAVRAPEFGTKKILQSWWRRAKGVEPRLWSFFCKEGLIEEGRARRWGLQVFGRPEDSSWY